MPPEAVIGAANRFVAFFRELRETFIEREDLLKQIALALLAREHLLMTGPPGTAKSKLAQAVLGRILCEETHQPSVFSRQFTESTVQTDLVGPINFKTLMETGRTEHFTDEGMLGATHAFLDEVFDGRDMLLRSTLNLLHERELKQGTRISRGKIECALMTSNRYLVEVLASERLVAFVDRIAFLNFVPKGFSNPDALPEVLRRQVSSGGLGPGARAPLTIQDLDALQVVVDAVAVSPALCASVAALARSYEAAIGEARRADPSFSPSRYVSTRGVVRLGQMLRAICFHDWAFEHRDRPLEASHADLAGLRLGLTLCGPGLADIDKLLLDEPDPRERRQLAIVRTERAIFERCLAELPVTEEPAVRAPLALAMASAVDLTASTPAGLLERARTLAAVSARHELPAEDVAAQLGATLEELVGRALRAGMSPGHHDVDPLAVVAELGKLADDIDQVSPAHRGVTRWLRGKALALAGQVAAVGPSPFAAGELHGMAAEGDVAAMKHVADTQLERLERLSSLRAALRHAGAVEGDASADTAWAEAITRTAERLWPELAAAVAVVAGGALKGTPQANLKYLLDYIAPALENARQAAARLTALGGDGNAFFARVVTGSLEPLVAHAFRTLDSDGESRKVVSATLAENLAQLADAGVLALIPAPRLALWIAEALLRTDRRKPYRFRDRGATAGHVHYRRMRKNMPASTLALTLVELVPKFPGLREGADPDGVVARIAELVRSFPGELRAQLVARDLEYVEAPIAFLEAWWAELVKSLPADAGQALQHLMSTQFFSITHDECALARFEHEARLVAAVFEGAAIEPLLDRTAALARTSTELVDRLSLRRLEDLAPGQPARAAGGSGG